ncbi:unnamed protein product [Acanthosepion pharaonis]|uniref:Uncharacterized protein n=1 Tax=Acanthosepion pharaonis TaxID=158019 RepID=A0A812BYH7_ACAPH|nr:unnamed protein product [Sepia pharaonis]
MSLYFALSLSLSLSLSFPLSFPLHSFPFSPSLPPSLFLSLAPFSLPPSLFSPSLLLFLVVVVFILMLFLSFSFSPYSLPTSSTNHPSCCPLCACVIFSRRNTDHFSSKTSSTPLLPLEFFFLSFSSLVSLATISFIISAKNYNFLFFMFSI